MVKQTLPSLLIRTNLVLALAMTSWVPATATAAEEPITPMKGGEHRMMPSEAKTGQPADGRMSMKSCQAMKDMEEKSSDANKAPQAEKE